MGTNERKAANIQIAAIVMMATRRVTHRVYLFKKDQKENCHKNQF